MEFIKNHISATLNEGVIASVIPVQKSSKKSSHASQRIPENLIKLQKNERTLVVQRQHFMTLLTPILISSSVFLIFSLFVVLLKFQHIIQLPPLPGVDLLLVVICFLSTFGIFSYLYWYYQFYIITNKCILHKHFFRLGGHHSEEVFLETSPEREITRTASNFLYSLLDIEDIVVHFQRPGLGEFIFTAPEKPQDIEDALESVSINLGKL